MIPKPGIEARCEEQASIRPRVFDAIMPRLA